MLLGRRYPKADIEAQTGKLNLTRTQIRQAMSELTVSERVVYHEIKGKSGSHFEPVTPADSNGDTHQKVVVFGVK